MHNRRPIRRFRFPVTACGALLVCLSVQADPVNLDLPTEIELPEIGDSSSAALSPTEEAKIANQVLAEVRRSGLMVEDGVLEDYLDHIGQGIVAQAEATEDFRFFWLNDPRINAFAVPGGAIGVHTGLLLNSQSESELASVLAHEISHVTQRHGARSVQAANRLTIPMAVAMVGAILATIANPEIGQAALAAANAGGQQIALNFTRANEKEADRIGMQVLARSGFDPRAMADFFERLQTANRYNDPKQIPEYLRTHPVTENRIAEARSLADRYPPKLRQDPDDFFLVRARTQAYTATRPEEIAQYFESALRTGKFAHEESTRYGYALALMRKGDFDLARVQMDRLIQSAPERPEYVLGRVEIDHKQGRHKQAYAAVLALSERFPNHRPTQLALAELALENGQHQKALQVLRGYPYQYSTDARYYRMLAQAESRGGSAVESHIALSEYYAMVGDPRLSMEQLRLARDSRGVDTYQRSRIEAKLADLEREQAKAEGREVEARDEPPPGS